MQDWSEERNARNMPLRRIWLTLAAITLVVGVFFWWIASSYSSILHKEVGQDTSSTLHARSSALKLTLERRLLLGDGLKAYVSTVLQDGQSLNDAGFNAFASRFIGNMNGVRNLSVYPGGTATFVYPYDTNKTILGMNIFKSSDPEVLANAVQTKSITSQTLLGPRELTQGGIGLISRQSVFKDGLFWGFVSVVLDLPPILEEAGLTQNDNRIDIAVKADGKLVFGRKAIFDDSSVLTSIMVANQYWEIAALPGSAKLDASNSRIEITRGSCLLILILLNYLVYVQLTRRRKLQTMVQERTMHLIEAHQQLEATYEELVAAEDELRVQNSLLEYSEGQLRQVAYRDGVTGLYNRAYFQERLEETIAAAGNNGRSFALLFLDLDQFKLINDTLGHASGDLLLQEVAHRLSMLLNQDELFSRIGGDEFTIIIPSVEEADYVHEAARQVIELFQQPYMLQEVDYYVTASIGVTVFPDHSTDAAELMKYADAAMYRAKEEGKNNYRIFDVTLMADTEDKIYIKNSLRRALENNEFEAHYQPQVEIETNRIVGLEALIRWNHPKRGIIPPSVFIPIAEESGLMEQIGEWMLRKACHQNKAWQDAGLPHVRVAVNLSARQFSRRSLLSGQVKAILAESGLNPAYLELEITENTAMLADNSDTLQELQNLGMTISIDDFGTQYSSLNYLKQLPVDKIKIDRSFVNGIRKEPKDEAIILAMLLMASRMNLSIVAEGVETQEQLAFLRENHCYAIQGYLFYRPQPADAMERILREHKALPH
ncbi:EAL domain-containing protein [Paenibacillus rhizovicinus]|uniref:EAL domain-containing protein n=1 Tax=Paenibacillus rhizovicinus TaxID=2704463 RepID=A0A6C0P1P5_9BACL|nr:EAL domain-containing protein [Paenibacillus rhizovicinus]QHW32414.1 EAL domain-containing protein [Paenibacillus rhizovicinus]